MGRNGRARAGGRGGGLQARPLVACGAEAAHLRCILLLLLAPETSAPPSPTTPARLRRCHHSRAHQPHTPSSFMTAATRRRRRRQQQQPQPHHNLHISHAAMRVLRVCVFASCVCVWRARVTGDMCTSYLGASVTISLCFQRLVQQ